MKIDSSGMNSLVNNSLSSNGLSSNVQSENKSALGSSVENKASSLLKSGASQADRVSLTQAATDAVGAELEESQVFHGKQHIIIMPPSEKTDRMEAVLNRLGDEQQQVLIDSNLLMEDDFLALAEMLSDEELSAFSSVVEGLQTLPKLNHFAAIDLTGFTAAKALVDTLSTMDEGTRGRVLEQAASYASKIPPFQGDETYNADGSFLSVASSSMANNLHNFVNAVNKSDDAGLMLDKLDEFSEDQQSDLLQILGTSVEMGDRLMEALSDRDTNAQDAMLNLLSEVAQSARGYAPDIRPVSGSGNGGAILEHDNYGGQVVWDMVEDSIALMESYQFSDEQVEVMATELTHMERSDQRAYLEITKTGLAHLLGEGGEQTIALDEHQGALATVEALRGNASVRDTVFKSRMGEETISDGTRFYGLKDEGESHRDQTATIELLVTDTWLNQGASESDISLRSTQLANLLGEMGAEQRDGLVHELNRFGQGDIPLAQRALSDLQDENQGLSNRVGSLIQSDDVEALLTIETMISGEQKEDFWTATELAGGNVDPLVNLLQQSDGSVRSQIVEALAQQSGLVDSGTKSRDEAVEQVDDLIEFFEQSPSEQDAQSYLEQLLS
jgi:hypothetical protein